jgi:hypothetical protein
MEINHSSIHELPPIETGGIEARKGLSFQDHVAACFLLEMFENEDLEQVWCETQDDITLIWNANGNERVEFVQAKSNNLNQLWSVAELCKLVRKDSKESKSSPSILERSLQYDRCKEFCCFRIITTVGPNRELSILKLPIESSERNRNPEKINALKKKISKRLPGMTSPKGNTTDYWVDHTNWDARHDIGAVNNDNLLRIHSISEQIGEYLARDQIEELYAKLLGKVRVAAEANWVFVEAKKIHRTDFIQWFTKMIQMAAHPGQANAGENLKRKMELADMGHEVQTAANLRRRYRESVLQPRYISQPDRALVEGEIEALLHKLRSDLDTQAIHDNGPSFHSRCLQEISKIRSELEKSNILESVPPEHLMIGFMYNLTDRCPHRFAKAGI